MAYAGPNKSAKLCSMCGRYRLTAKERYIREHFELEEDPSWAPRYNIAPTQPVAVVRQDADAHKRTLRLLRWGLNPPRASSGQSGPPVINARSESIAEKAFFREALQARRCLVPADAFYEFKKVGKAKVPYCFEVNGGKLFAFAGIWERSRNSKGEPIEACCILTTAPNEITSQIHDRMPAILDSSGYGIWLDS